MVRNKQIYYVGNLVKVEYKKQQENKVWKENNKYRKNREKN